MLFDENAIKGFDKGFRVNFINSLSGFKSANLIGTCNGNDLPNLSLFSSAVHLGADPALLGLISRPDSVVRDTLENIREVGEYTINHVHAGIYQQAHQSSARYPSEVSEFEVCGLTPEYFKGFKAPAVLESHIKILLSLEDVIPIPSNGCQLIIGTIKTAIVPVDALYESGSIDLSSQKTVTISSLDRYHNVTPINQLSYAKPNSKPSIVTEGKVCVR